MELQQFISSALVQIAKGIADASEQLKDSTSEVNPRNVDGTNGPNAQTDYGYIADDSKKKIRKAEFTFEDFLDQLEQLKKMGPLEDILGMMPGMNKVKGLKDMKVDDRQLVRVEAIVRSMTKTEKANPEILNASRRRRIAKGSGTTIQDVNRLLKQFEDMKKMMKQFSGMGKKIKGKKIAKRGA